MGVRDGSWIARIGAILALFALIACALPGDGTPHRDRDPIRVARDLARADPLLSYALGATHSPGFWHPDGLGFVATATRGGAVSARLPGDTGGALELGLSAGASVSVRLDGARATRARLEAGSVVYRDAYPSVDVVMTARGGRFEELLLLRNTRAPTQFAWDVGLGRGVTEARLEDGGLRFSDPRGRGVLRVPRPYAIDAAGIRRDAELAWSDGRLRVSLDTTGLDFPVLLDPAVETFVWSEETPTTHPPARYAFAMAYDATRDNTVIFSGEGCHGANCNGTLELNDTWTWNGTKWTRMSPASPPGRRTGAAMVYDAASQTSLLFGGFRCIGKYCNLASDLGDTWQWDGTEWTELTPATSPPVRDSHMMSYDSERGVVVLFGGESFSGSYATLPILSDTWEWNGTTWVERTPAQSPPAREGGGMAYDSVRGVTVLFGGLTCLDPECMGIEDFNDTWEWDGTNWTDMSPATSPSARDGFAMTFDPVDGVTLLFSGNETPADTWTWDGSIWTSVTMATAPPQRASGNMTFDSARRRVVLFGGDAAYELEDTWELYSHGGACTSASQCDSGFCVDGVCCDTSSCTTCEACNTAATPGTCGVVTNAVDPDNCYGTKMCNASGECTSVTGQPCPNGNTDCANGACVDGYCCDSACTSACEVCAAELGATANGTCGPAVAGYSGNPACSQGYLCNGSTTTCPSACVDDPDCAEGYYCSAASACVAQEAIGATCDTTAGAGCLHAGCRECASGSCVDGVCCDSECSGACLVCSQALGAPADGTCGSALKGSAGAPSCAPYVCTATLPGCPTACTDDSDCADGAFCQNGVCVGDQGISTACGASGACASTFCVDGVCCNAACTGQCEACDVTGSVGVCTPVTGKPHGPRPSCAPGSDADVCAAAECDGDDRAGCAGFVGPSETCREGGCAAGVATLPASCNGLGRCPAPVTVKCAPYACVGTSCNQACSADGDCAAGNRCDVAAAECVAGVTCDGQHTITGENGQESDCAPYACNASGCLTTCASVSDCAAPAACDESGRCVVLAATGGVVEVGGCSSGGPGGRPSDEAAPLMALLWLGVRRRRRVGGL